MFELDARATGREVEVWSNLRHSYTAIDSPRIEVRVGLLTMEHYFACPYCGEQISMVLDLSVEGQTYVEDCEVCCNPIEISYRAEEEELSGFEARALR